MHSTTEFVLIDKAQSRPVQNYFSLAKIAYDNVKIWNKNEKNATNFIWFVLHMNILKFEIKTYFFSLKYIKIKNFNAFCLIFGVYDNIKIWNKELKKCHGFCMICYAYENIKIDNKILEECHGFDMICSAYENIKIWNKNIFFFPQIHKN